MKPGLLADLGAGTICALVSLSYTMGYAALVFSGQLTPLLQDGIPTLLLGCFLVGTVVALRSSLPLAIAGPDANSAAVLAVALAGIAHELAGQGHGQHERLLSTVMVALALSALATGLAAYLLGRLRQGAIVQLMPHSVMAGFLAGTGLLICNGALRILSGHAPGLEALQALRAGPALVPLAALGLAGVLLGLPVLRRHALGLPLTLLLACAAFFAAAAAQGLSFAELRAQGLLFEPLSLHGMQPPWTRPLGEVDWSALLAHAPDLAAAVLIAQMTILLNAAGLELSTRRRVDADRELRAAGLANLLSGFCGGFMGYQSISRSLLNQRAGAHSRLAGLWAALLCPLLVLVFPASLSLLPKPVLAGLLLYLGLSMLQEWALTSRRQLPRHEYLLVLAILGVIAVKGFVLGVLLGLLGACGLFAWSYGRIGCVRGHFSGRGRRSRVRRSLAEERLLARHGEAVFGLSLQGYLYFGTAKAFVARVEAALVQAPRQTVLIDMGAVHGVDTSALLSFRRLRQCFETGPTVLAFAGLDAEVRHQLQAIGVLGGPVRDFADLDHALEWSEERLIASHAGDAAAEGAAGDTPALRHLLAPHFSAPHLERLLALLEPWSIAAGERVYERGQAADSMLFIEQGRLGVSLPLEAGASVRLGSYGPGTLVGELALFSGEARSADVVAEQPTRALRLSRAGLRELESLTPGAALELKTLVVQSLAIRLVAASHEVMSLSGRAGGIGSTGPAG